MTALLVVLALVVAYAFGRAVGQRLAVQRLRVGTPRIVIAECVRGLAPKLYRVEVGEVYEVRASNGILRVGFERTRPLPVEVGRMLEEVTK